MDETLYDLLTELKDIKYSSYSTIVKAGGKNGKELYYDEVKSKYNEINSHIKYEENKPNNVTFAGNKQNQIISDDLKLYLGILNEALNNQDYAESLKYKTNLTKFQMVEQTLSLITEELNKYQKIKFGDSVAYVYKVVSGQKNIEEDFELVNNDFPDTPTTPNLPDVKNSISDDEEPRKDISKGWVDPFNQIKTFK